MKECLTAMMLSVVVTLLVLIFHLDQAIRTKQVNAELNQISPPYWSLILNKSLSLELMENIQIMSKSRKCCNDSRHNDNASTRIYHDQQVHNLLKCSISMKHWPLALLHSTTVHFTLTIHRSSYRIRCTNLNQTFNWMTVMILRKLRKFSSKP